MRNRTRNDRAHLANDSLWYKDAILYELHVRAFHDSNADGIGDFRGVLEKMDYLQDLGVTALWLLPFYPSPLRDDGYDISDYTDVNAIYGSLADLKTLLREAHRRGMRVITELVINHTSDKHPWFQRARRAAPSSAWRNHYVWNDTPEKYKDVRIIFKDFEHSNWSWDALAKAFYWHRFYAHQPDLNFDNPAVQRAIIDVLDFWLNLGIDGMRLDAVPYLFEREGTTCENLPETHAFLKTLRTHVDEKYHNRMLLAEANQWPEDAVSYFGAGDECHMAFHFPVMPRLFMAIRMEDRFPLIDILRQTPAIPENSQWALFLRNHDELTLEMVTAEDRDYMYRVYAQDAHARLNLGIRRRLAPLLENHRGKIELMNGLLFSLPGTPVLYYGDEIGMGDNIFLGDRNGVRTPMQWSPERNAGFSHANPQRLYLPVVIDPEYHYQTVNVEAQQSNPHSLLWWMKHLIALRKRHQAFGRGSLEFLDPENHKVLAFVRRYQGEQILVVANLSRFMQCVELDLSEFKGSEPVEMFGRSMLPAVTDRLYQLTLGAYAFYWLLFEPVTASRPSTLAESRLPALAVTGVWQNIFEGPAAESLELHLPAYLRTQHWFTGKGGVPTSARIIENIPFDHGNAWIMLVQVEYTLGEAKRFVLPITFRETSGNTADGIGSESMPPTHCQIASLSISTADTAPKAGILYDALADAHFGQTLLEAIARHRRFRGKRGQLYARTTAACHRLRDLPRTPLASVQLKGEQNNTSIAFGDRFVLKILRWVEGGVNPEVEVPQALAERTTCNAFPTLAGTLNYHAGDEMMTWGTLSKFVPNESDAWIHTVEAVRRFFEHVLTRGEKPPDPVFPHQPFLDVVQQDLPPMASDRIGSFLESARLMGHRAAELHIALASITDDPAFTPEPFTIDYQRSTFQTVRNWVYRVGQLVRSMMPTLSEAARADAQVVLGREADIIQYLRVIMSRRITAMRIRCHGDFRLGSLLYTGRDFAVIDFEGETLRSLSNRRHKRSPLRDVAAWIHSIYVATQSVLQDEHLRHEDRPVIEPWARFWQWWVAVAFVREYLATAGSAGFLPQGRDEMQIVLDYCLLGRAIYEVRYHLLNHPERCQIALKAVLQILHERDRQLPRENEPAASGAISSTIDRAGLADSIAE
jgi:maltose alpha-D-glucosyltransferase / alpha-amylase